MLGSLYSKVRLPLPRWLGDTKVSTTLGERKMADWSPVQRMRHDGCIVWPSLSIVQVHVSWGDRTFVSYFHYIKRRELWFILQAKKPMQNE